MLVRSPGFSPSRLGITDRHGRLDAFCTPERGVTFELLTSIDTPLGLCPEPTDLPPGGEVEVEIEVVTGSLVLRFPPDFEVPDGVGLRPALTIVGGHLAKRRFGPEPDSTDPLGVRPARDLGAIAIGNYAIRIVGDSWLVNDGQIVGREERDLLEGDCEVRAGERAVCVLRSTTR